MSLGLSHLNGSSTESSPLPASEQRPQVFQFAASSSVTQSLSTPQLERERSTGAMVTAWRGILKFFEQWQEGAQEPGGWTSRLPCNRTSGDRVSQSSLLDLLETPWGLYREYISFGLALMETSKLDPRKLDANSKQENPSDLLEIRSLFLEEVVGALNLWEDASSSKSTFGLFSDEARLALLRAISAGETDAATLLVRQKIGTQTPSSDLALETGELTTQGERGDSLARSDSNQAIARSSGARRGGGGGGGRDPRSRTTRGRGEQPPQKAHSWVNDSLLTWAVGNADGKVVGEMLQTLRAGELQINHQLPTGKTALYLAVESNLPVTVEALLRHGARIELATCSGRNPLYAAVELNHGKCLETLCTACKVDHITQRAQGGVSPFMLAENRGRVGMVLTMLRAYQRACRLWLDVEEEPGDKGRGAKDNPFHPYLSDLCQKFKFAIAEPSHKQSTSELSSTRACWQSAHSTKAPSPFVPGKTSRRFLGLNLKNTASGFLRDEEEEDLHDFPEGTSVQQSPMKELHANDRVRISPCPPPSSLKKSQKKQLPFESPAKGEDKRSPSMVTSEVSSPPIKKSVRTNKAITSGKASKDLSKHGGATGKQPKASGPPAKRTKPLYLSCAGVELKKEEACQQTLEAFFGI